MLEDFKTRSVGIEMMNWKRKLKEAFGKEGGTKAQNPLNRREQVDNMFEEDKSLVPRLDERIMQVKDELGPVNTPLPDTSESKS